MLFRSGSHDISMLRSADQKSYIGILHLPDQLGGSKGSTRSTKDTTRSDNGIKEDWNERVAAAHGKDDIFAQLEAEIENDDDVALRENGMQELKRE